MYISFLEIAGGLSNIFNILMINSQCAFQIYFFPWCADNECQNNMMLFLTNVFLSLTYTHQSNSFEYTVRRVGDAP